MLHTKEGIESEYFNPANPYGSQDVQYAAEAFWFQCQKE